MTHQNIIPFSFNSHAVRVIQDDDGAFWFIAKEIADVLGYTDAEAMTRRLDEDEKQNRQIVGFGPRGVTTINESGLYAAILNSKKPEAKPFKKWVTSEVLPSIRKTGSYSANSQNPSTPLPEPEPYYDVAREFTPQMVHEIATFITSNVASYERGKAFNATFPLVYRLCLLLLIDKERLDKILPKIHQPINNENFNSLQIVDVDNFQSIHRMIRSLHAGQISTFQMAMWIWTHYDVDKQRFKNMPMHEEKAKRHVKRASDFLTKVIGFNPGEDELGGLK